MRPAPPRTFVFPDSPPAGPVRKLFAGVTLVVVSVPAVSRVENNNRTCALVAVPLCVASTRNGRMTEPAATVAVGAEPQPARAAGAGDLRHEIGRAHV